MSDETKKPVGRPLKFANKEILQEKINAFFAECDKKNEPYTITGLALALDTSRETLIDYQNRDEFTDTIKRAKMKVENGVEKMLFDSKRPTAGAIFALKNFGWSDKTNLDHSSSDGSMTPQSPVVVLPSKDD